ncbi:hypothetical protein FB45DRAFT_800313 [Roridomyces roridus]|uniref:Uncharacterized protein n=1 Tax=Roridomyces roridus TaxID=1738132 RepID=A0AAD7BEW3_9AGAR|nr:hypothetical protein FB45DRAFT_800313 [Roridomyces roridus]
MILNAYLAYASQRSYVFDNYTWNRDGPDFFLETDGRMRIARFPLSSMISGPIIGGDMPDKDVPRAVSREYFLDVCDNRTQVIDTNSVWNGDGGVAEMMLRWADKLKSIDAPCVEIASWSPTLFDYKITNTERVLDVFPDLAKSPILADLGWSPLILDCFARNYKFFGGKTTPPELDPLVTTRTPLHGLLTLHVRRGDYEGWCREAFPHSMSFVGFNSFHEFPDSEKFRLWNTSYEDTMLHCLPDIDQIIEKVLAVVTPDSGIERIYLMTNGRYPWLGELVSALKAAGSWSVATSRDLSLSFEGKHVSQALDMYVGQRSDRFIGNGFSSLTSNVVMLRMANPELDGANRTYFW